MYTQEDVPQSAHRRSSLSKLKLSEGSLDTKNNDSSSTANYEIFKKTKGNALSEFLRKQSAPSEESLPGSEHTSAERVVSDNLFRKSYNEDIKELSEMISKPGFLNIYLIKFFVNVFYPTDLYRIWRKRRLP